MGLSSIDGGLRVENMFADVLERQAKSFALGQRLAQLHPELVVVETASHLFDVDQFARDGKCKVTPRDGVHNQFVAQWSPTDGVVPYPRIAHLHVDWEGTALQVVKVSWESSYGENQHFGVLAADGERCDAFIDAVCRWNHEVRGEILLYAGGCFSKSTKLYQAITNASFDNLVLHGSLKDQIREDFTQFLTSRETYESHGVPWKRGALFLGPPGNGKTMCVKALVRLLAIPCLYVQSFKAEYTPLQSSIETLFQRARETAPCVIVLEDIDSLLGDDARSFFLNELDGFAANTGIITLATTNHPEKLDPAIIHRPSRFDRKYHFNLPDAATRADYIAMWNARLRPALRLTDEGCGQLVELTEGFSFAYIQEVFVSSMMRWMSTRDSIGILGVATAQISELRTQMATPAT